MNLIFKLILKIFFINDVNLYEILKKKIMSFEEFRIYERVTIAKEQE